ncbi:unnamed protein product, partial [Rotaria sordida]
MCPLYFCPLRQNHQPFISFVTLYKHIRSIHRNDIPFNIRCTLNPVCGSIYTNFESYRSHLNRYHHDLLNDYNVPNYYTVNGNQQPPSLLLSNPNIIQDEEDKCIAAQDNLDPDELETFERTRSSENDIDWPLFTSLINEEDDMEQFTINTFEKYYIRFLLDLREGHLLPQNIIKSITSYFTAMLDTLFKIIQHQATQSSTGLLFPLEDIKKLILQIITSVSNITKNDYQFSKRCEEHFGYLEPLKIQLNDQDDCGYYVPIQQSIKNLLNKPDTKNDPDLMLTYRDGTAAKDNPSLKLHPNSFLIQLYSDGIGVTNPIGPKKDEHKLTLYYFVLEDLPDVIRSILQSIGLVGICPTKYLSLQTNRIKYFEPIVKDLNYLQTAGLAAQTFN